MNIEHRSVHYSLSKRIQRPANGLPSFIVCLLAFYFATVAFGAQDIQPCKEEDEQTWITVNREALGVWATDSQQWIGEPVAKRWGKANWYPIDGTKQVACGELFRWSLFQFVPKELDLHSHIHPSGTFTYLLADVVDYSKSEHANEIWGEVTPPKGFQKEFWGGGRPRFIECTCSEGNDRCKIRIDNHQILCMYGPWVAESIHGWRPEIHPLQQFWRVDPESKKLSLYLLRDVSNRFGNSRFGNSRNFTRTRQKQWKNWMPKPLVGKFYIAYRIPERQSATSLSFTEIGSKKVIQREGTITVGSDTITVSAPRTVVVESEFACRARDSSVIGYLLLTMTTPEKGYQVLTLDRDEILPKAAVVPELNPQPPEELQPSVVVDAVSIPSPPSPLRDQRNWPKTQTEWRISNARPIEWLWYREQDLRLLLNFGGSPEDVEVFSEEPNRSLIKTIAWSFKATNIETGADIPIFSEKAASSDHVVLVAEVARGLNMTASPPMVRLRKTEKNPAVVKLNIIFPLPITPKVGLYRYKSVAVDVDATLTDNKNRLGKFHERFYSLAPERTVGLDLTRESGWADVTRDEVLNSLEGDLHTTPEQLEGDWHFEDPNGPTASLPQLPNDIRRRRARILRLYGRNANQDRIITPSEWDILLKLAKKYAETRPEKR